MVPKVPISSLYSTCRHGGTSLLSKLIRALGSEEGKATYIKYIFWCILYSTKCCRDLHLHHCSMIIMTQSHHARWYASSLSPFWNHCGYCSLLITDICHQSLAPHSCCSCNPPLQQLEFQEILLIYLEVPFYFKGKSHFVDLTSTQVSDPILTPS